MPTKRVSKNDEFDVWVGREYYNGEQYDLGKAIRYKEVKKGWLGNPYRVQDCTSREQAIELFERDLLLVLQMNPWVRYKLLELYDKRLACDCRTHEKCHGDVIVSKVNALYWKNKQDGLPRGKVPNVPLSDW